MLGLLKSGKLRLRRTIDQGDLIKLPGDCTKVRPDHEDILLDGTAQFVRYGETLRDRSGRLDNINSQEVARPQQFIIGNDGTGLELSVESRSFVNRVNDQVRKRQKRISNVAGEGEEHSILHEALRRLVNDIHLVVLDLPLDVIELHIHSDAQAKDVLFD